MSLKSFAATSRSICNHKGEDEDIWTNRLPSCFSRRGSRGSPSPGSLWRATVSVASLDFGSGYNDYWRAFIAGQGVGTVAHNRFGLIISFFVLGVTACSGPIRPEGDWRMNQVKGRIVFVSDWNGKEEIFDMDTDGRGLRRLTTTKGGTGSWQPALSPEGTRIAFASDREGNSEIYVMSADGQAVERLTHTPDKEKTPAWSPDGKQIAFISQSGDERKIFSLRVMGFDGSNVRCLLQYTDRYVARPDWSPDGTKLVFSAGKKDDDDEWKWDIYVLDISSGTVRQVTRDSKVYYQACWSPDGTRFVFDSTHSDNWDIYVMDVDGSNVQRLTHYDGVDARPVWSPLGTSIAFHSHRDAGHSEIYVMDADGANMRRLTNSEEYAVHPDW